MRIAYIITAYKDPVQLARLIDSVNNNADFYIHIDLKSKIEPFNQLLLNKPNTYLTEVRYPVNWASFSQVNSQKELLKEVINSKIKYGRIVCLSGMDYPIWPTSKIVNEFEMHQNTQYIMGFNLSKSNNKSQKDKVAIFHFFRDINIRSLTVLRLIRGLSRIIMKVLPVRRRTNVKISGERKDIYMGSDYWALTYECAKYVHEVMCKEKALMDYFKYSFAPSEMVIQTIVFNSPFRADVLSCNAIDYNGLRNLTPLHYIDYGNSKIRIFDEGDFDTLVKSGKMFFRKASTGISDKLIILMDKHRSDIS